MIIRIANDGGMTVIELVPADGAGVPVTAIETAEAAVPRAYAPAPPKRRWLRYTGTVGVFTVALVIGMALGGFHATPAGRTQTQPPDAAAFFRRPEKAKHHAVASAQPAGRVGAPAPAPPGQGVPPRIAAALLSHPTVAGTASSPGSPSGATPDPEKLFGLQP